MDVIGPLLHALKVAYMYIFNWKNVYCIYLFAFFVFFYANHMFVLTDKNSNVAGHLSFQKRKKWGPEIA